MEKIFYLTLQKGCATMQDFPNKDNQMPTNFEFVDSSERARTIDADGARAQIGIEKYPWRTLPEGKSFFVDTNKDVVKLTTMQAAASRWSKKLNKQFRVIKWENGIEVARLPDKTKDFGFGND